LQPDIKYGGVAQLVEQRTENPCVGGSIPSLTTTLKNKSPFMHMQNGLFNVQYFEYQIKLELPIFDFLPVFDVAQTDGR
jgi:hypothetical protein